MAKKENIAEIKPIAEVQLGGFVLRLTEEEMSLLKDINDYVKDGFKDSILEVQDYIISTYDQFTKENSGKVVQLLSSLHGYLDFFKCLGELDIKYEEKNT